MKNKRKISSISQTIDQAKSKELQPFNVSVIDGIGWPINNGSKSSLHETIYTEPILVLSTLFKALDRINNIELKIMMMNECVQMQKELHINEFGDLPDYELPGPICPTLIKADLFTIIYKLEQAIGYLVMPGARFKAMFSIVGLRSNLMWKVYGIDGAGKWAFASGQRLRQAKG